MPPRPRLNFIPFNRLEVQVCLFVFLVFEFDYACCAPQPLPQVAIGVEVPDVRRGA